MDWDGKERRLGKDRRVHERRLTMRYDVQALIIIDGITWIDPGGKDRRTHIRRRQDREALARKLLGDATTDENP